MASPHVPAELEPPEVEPAEEAPEEVPEEEPTEEPAEEEPAEESEEEESVELGQLVQHVQKTIKPTLKRFPRLKLSTGNVAGKAHAAVAQACQCGPKAANMVRVKLDKKLRKRGYPSGAGDKLLAGIVELTKRLDTMARAKAQNARSPKARVAARALNLTRGLPLTHPVRCRAVRLMLTCTP